MKANSDNKWIDEVLKGNVEAFSHLVEKYQQMAFSLSMKILHNREEAEESAQDAFIKAYQSLGRFQQTAAFKTWFFRIVYTTAISRTRKIPRNQVSFEDYQLSEAQLEDAETTLGQLSPDERSKYLHDALERLEPDERAIINLYYFEDLTVEEVANIVELSVSNVKIKLFRSRKKLYGQLSVMMKIETVFP